MEKLSRLTDSPQSDSFLSVHCLLGFRLFGNDLGKGYYFCLSLEPDYGNQKQCLLATNYQTKREIEVMRSTAITVWASNRVGHNLCIK